MDVAQSRVVSDCGGNRTNLNGSAPETLPPARWDAHALLLPLLACTCKTCTTESLEMGSHRIPPSCVQIANRS